MSQLEESIRPLAAHEKYGYPHVDHVQTVARVKQALLEGQSRPYKREQCGLSCPRRTDKKEGWE